MSDLFDKLNEQQREAVINTEGYVRVIAGAGSGKTKALAHRYAYLVQELGIPPQNILGLTFTNKAAKEMKNRIRQLTGGDFDTSFVATLHSFCTRILREDISKLFYPENFIVLDPSDQKKILEEIYDELGIRMDTASFQFMIDKIKYYKNLISYCDYILRPEANIAHVEPKDLEEKIILNYIQKQKKYFGLDFFDLINFVIYLFRNHSDVLEKWQKRMHYVMVDEFQDITAKEFKLIRHLTEEHQNFFVVGDPDQNIYEWRGSRMEVLIDFEEHLKKYFDDSSSSYFPNQKPIELKGEFKTIMMNENYRSTPQILDAANALISKNKLRVDKELSTKNKPGKLPLHVHAKSEHDEMKFITERIAAYVEEGGKYYDVAILYRSNHVSRFIEQGLMKANIPYTVYGGVGFYDRMEIKDVLSYLRLVAYGDDLSFQRVINVPRRKIGKTKLVFIKERAEKENLSMYDCLVKYRRNEIFKGCGSEDFIDVIEGMRELVDKITVSELLQKLLIDAKYELYIRESGDMDRLDNISELLRCVVQIENDFAEPLPLRTFLQDVSLNRDIEDNTDAKDCVRIMTIHVAKGLEFPIVFIAGANEAVFPSIRALEQRREEALEEERRLCFVAMTRAKRELYITESEGLGVRGLSKTPSRFLFDIDNACMERTGEISELLMIEMKTQTKMSEHSPQSAKFALGSQVRHKVFGEGIIEEVDEVSKTYAVRFMQGTKPIGFGYQGLAQVF